MTALTVLTLNGLPEDVRQLEGVLSGLPSLQRLRLRMRRWLHDPRWPEVQQAVQQCFPHLVVENEW